MCKDVPSIGNATYEKTKDDRSLGVSRQNCYLGHKIRQVLRQNFEPIPTSDTNFALAAEAKH